MTAAEAGPSEAPRATRPGTLRAGWRTLAAAPERILVPVIAILVPATVAHVLLQYFISAKVAGTTECVRDYLGGVLYAECSPGNTRAQLGVLVGFFVLVVLAHVVVAGVDRAILDVLDDEPVRGPYAGWSLRTVLPAALLLGAMLTMAAVFLVLPAIVLAFFTRYALLFVVDAGLNPLAAVAASFGLVTRRLRSEVGFAVRSLLVLLLGVLACGVGLFVAVPVVLIAQALRYRDEPGPLGP